MNESNPSLELYNRKQEFIGFLKTIKSDVDYTIRKASTTWSVDAITAAEELLDVLRYYETEITFYRNSIQERLDKLSGTMYTEEVEEEVT